MTTSKRPGFSRWAIYLIAFFAITAAIFFAFPYLYSYLEHSYYSNREADPGAIFDGVSALFSAIAFGGLLLTIILQAYELSLQRQELEDTRSVLSLQQFDGTFFNLTSLHNEIVRGMLIVKRKPNLPELRLEGRPALHWIARELGNALDRAREKNLDVGQLIRTAYQEIFDEHRDLLGHYFRNLYHIVKYVDRNPKVNQRQYTSFLRAQLSGTELQLLFFNCLSPMGKEFDKLAVRYALLEHLPIGGAVEPEFLTQYPEKAYGDNAYLLELYSAVNAKTLQHESDTEPNP